MRLLVVELHRAFPELDPFTDQQCLSYVAEARKQFASVWMPMQALGVFLCLAMLFLSCFIGAFLASFLDDTLDLDIGSPAHPLIMVCVLGSWWLAAGWTPFALRDVGLRRAIRKRLDGACCSGCGYSLLGLAVADNRVLCPECGKHESLTARGLTPADILSPTAPTNPQSEGARLSSPA